MPKTFDIDVTWVVGKTYKIEADTAEEAREIVQKMVDAGEVSVWTDGFEATDDVDVTVVGESLEDK